LRSLFSFFAHDDDDFALSFFVFSSSSKKPKSPPKSRRQTATLITTTDASLSSLDFYKTPRARATMPKREYAILRSFFEVFSFKFEEAKRRKARFQIFWEILFFFLCAREKQNG